MEVKDLLKKLDITEDSYEEGGKTVVVIANSDDYSKVFTKLDNADYLNIEDESTIVTGELGEAVFFDEDYRLRLIADFVDDVYRLVIEKE